MTTRRDLEAAASAGSPSCGPRRCRCSTRRLPAATRFTARCRRRTTRRRSRAPCSGSGPASWRRWCSPARSMCEPRIAHDPAAIFGVLRDSFPVLLRVSRSAAARRPSSAPAPSCWCAARASAPAPSRSPAPPAAAPTRRSMSISREQLLHSAKDREENAIVARRIARVLAPYSVWVTAAPEPVGRARREHPAPRCADPRAARAGRLA